MLHTVKHKIVYFTLIQQLLSLRNSNPEFSTLKKHISVRKEINRESTFPFESHRTSV
uniref:Uncharacterized protein n=1 Tax=Octopus bimaculoides TaxID=37653 RepID=A0A0L8FN42_OCTBM